MVNLKRYHRTISRGFEYITEDFTLVSDSESDWRKIVKISQPGDFEKTEGTQSKFKGSRQISGALREDLG